MDERKSGSRKREKTLLVALLLSSPGPVLTGIAAVTSLSATQIADFLRRSAELVALFVSWWIYRKIQNNPHIETPRREKMTRFANKTVSIAMICSGIAMMTVGLFRIFFYTVNGNVVLGYVIAILGLITNAWFWWRYGSLNRETFDPVIESQQKLYRAKACVDLTVVIALTSVLIAPQNPATRYIDSAGCIIVAFYLAFSGIGMLREQKPLEKTENASEQLP
ncbi:MAG: cation transporter [Thermotogae bacterium]|nr:cation transporter [Thermotogota bacterium]